MRPRLLDLFCGAGGASVGYHRAGFDVTGVDNRPMPRYPYEFIQGDALDVLTDTAFLARFDAIHASPPCQAYSVTRHATGRTHDTAGLLPATLTMLRETGKPHVVENVPGSGNVLANALTLCGSSFGLRVRRHRHFVTSFACLAPPCVHGKGPPVVTVSGHGMQGHAYRQVLAGLRPPETEDVRREAMGIDWMNRDELAQAIPPAYTTYIGEQLMTALRAEVTA